MKNKNTPNGLIGVCFALITCGTLLAAWITHVVVCIKTASWGFLIAGAIAFPVAWVYGIGYWFGVW